MSDEVRFEFFVWELDDLQSQMIELERIAASLLDEGLALRLVIRAALPREDGEEG